MKTLDQLCEQISVLNKNLALFIRMGDKRRAEITRNLIQNILKTGNQFKGG